MVGSQTHSKEIETFASVGQIFSAYWKDISQFLQHCTVRRSKEFREWDLQQMWDKLEPTMKFFRETFPRTNISDVMIVGASMRSQSTATFSVTAPPVFRK